MGKETEKMADVKMALEYYSDKLHNEFPHFTD